MEPTRRAARPGGATGGSGQPGQALVEFAIAGTVFFMLVFGTLDFGRAVFMYAELHNAVREGARYAKVEPTDVDGIKQRVVDQAPGLGLTKGDVEVGACSGGCVPGTDSITVSAELPFRAITQELLGIAPITLDESATVQIE